MTDRETSLDRAVELIRKRSWREAISICRQLVDQDPQDAEAWSFLGTALVASSPEEALDALRRAVRLQPGEPRWHLNLGVALTRLGNFVIAEQACREAVNRSRGALDTLLPWADALIGIGNHARAVEVLREAIALRPDPVYYRRLAGALEALGNAKGALDAMMSATAGRDASVRDQLFMASLKTQLQEYDDAEKTLKALLASSPDNPDVALQAARLQQSKGDSSAAREILTTAFASNTAHPGLIATLLENDDLPEDAIVTAESIVADAAGPLVQRRAVAFALARHLDRQRDYEQAWHYLEVANDLYRERAGFDRDSQEQTLAAALSLYEQTEALATPEAPRLFYIVGPPRSGATLLQTLLAAVPGISSVGERGALLPWLLPMLGLAAEDRLAAWHERAGQLRDADLAGMRALDDSASGYVDKTTHHAHVVGQVARLHQGARFIDCRRDPRDIAISILFHDFPPAFAYARSLDDITNYLRFHRRAVEAWQAAGLDILIHDHEAFTSSPDDTGAILFETLELDWRDEYLAPENRRAVVQTFSVDQVRDEISGARSGRWRNYEAFAPDISDRLASLL